MSKRNRKKILMKKLLLISIFLFCLNYNHSLSQDLKIKWEDSKGRKFSINIVSGDFKWSSLKGDKIYHNSAGKVKSIGNVKIFYTYSGKVKSVGGVSIYYTYSGKVKSVGGVSVYYNNSGKVKSVGGTVY